MKTTPQYIKEEYNRKERIYKFRYFKNFIKDFRYQPNKFFDGISYCFPQYNLKNLLEKRGWEVIYSSGILYIRPQNAKNNPYF